MALAVRGKAESFFSEAQRGFRLLPGDSVRLRADMLAPLQKQSRELVEALATLASMSAQEEEPRLASLCRRASELSADLDFIRQAEDTTHVFWAEARKGVFFKAAPIDVAETLRKKLYSHLDTVVFTSATLTTSGKFQYFGRRMGLDVYAEEGNDVRAVSVPSPFDYASQAALYVPTHMPRPNQPEFSEACAEEVLQLVQVTQGRAFVLFTSLKQMETVHRLLEHRLEFQVLLQGQAPKRTLLAKFQEAPSVLFASHSFWEGVDVPGDALSLVVMDKLPFASPGDPLVAARVDALMAQGDNAFEMYQLPQAIISLRQGFGRLIRTRKDFGIVAVLDSRLRTHGYGRAFLNSLPPASRLNSIDDLNVWFSAATSHPVAREKNKTP